MKAKADMTTTIRARCIFDHVWDMTEEQLVEANRFGCAMCPTCGNAATVERVSVVASAVAPTPARGKVGRKVKHGK